MIRSGVCPSSHPRASAREAAVAIAQAVPDASSESRISLIAEVATAWLTMASDQEQLRLARETLKTFAETQRLTQAQFRIGVASELEARQAETNYQAARNDIAAAQTRVTQDQNALNLLVGTTVPAEQLPGELGATPVTRDALPPSLSSDVLLRRPDVLQAEHQLIAQNANIGAARAAFFPSITLTARGGLYDLIAAGRASDAPGLQGLDLNACRAALRAMASPEGARL